MAPVAALALSLIVAGACARATPPAAPDTQPYLIVLGTAQDGGLPHPACTCAHCEAARRDPARRRLVASLGLVVPSTGRRFLVDATPDIRAQLDRLPDRRRATGTVDRAPVDGVLLTHAHIGHYLGLAEFGFEAIHTHELPVYATPRMAAFLRAGGPWNRLLARDEIVLRDLRPDEAFELDGGVRVTPFTVPHRDEDSDTVGFRFQGPRRTVVYVPDTDAWTSWSPSVEDRLAGCDFALLDGTFFSANELPGRDPVAIGHPLIGTTIERLSGMVRGGRLRVAFTHLNHSNLALDPDGSARRSISAAGFEVADDGERIPL